MALATLVVVVLTGKSSLGGNENGSREYLGVAVRVPDVYVAREESLVSGAMLRRRQETSAVAETPQALRVFSLAGDGPIRDAQVTAAEPPTIESEAPETLTPPRTVKEIIIGYAWEDSIKRTESGIFAQATEED